MTLKQTVHELKTKPISQDLAVKKAIIALAEYVQRISTQNIQMFTKKVETGKSQLVESSESVLVENVLKTIVSKSQDVEEAKKELAKSTEKILKEFEQTQTKIQEVGKEKIKNGFVVFIFGNCPFSLSIVKAAKKQGKRFSVHTIKGGETEKKISGIPTICFEDLELNEAMKKVDLVLLDCNSLTMKGIFTKAGADLIAEISHKHNIPIYVSGPTIGLNTRYKKKENEVFIPYSFISGIISELSILPPLTFIKKVK